MRSKNLRGLCRGSRPRPYVWRSVVIADCVESNGTSSRENTSKPEWRDTDVVMASRIIEDENSNVFDVLTYPFSLPSRRLPSHEISRTFNGRIGGIERAGSREIGLVQFRCDSCVERNVGKVVEATSGAHVDFWRRRFGLDLRCNQEIFIILHLS